MKIKQLIKKLEKLDPNAEIMISETACANVHEISDVMQGWVLDNEFDAPEFIQDSEKPEDYDIDPKQKKVVCIE